MSVCGERAKAVMQRDSTWVCSGLHEIPETSRRSEDDHVPTWRRAKAVIQVGWVNLECGRC